MVFTVTNDRFRKKIVHPAQFVVDEGLIPGYFYNAFANHSINRYQA